MRRIKLQELKNGEYIQFFNDVLTIVKAEDSVKKNLEDYFIPLSIQVLKLEKAFKIHGNQLTAKIEEVDEKRDSAYIGLKGFVKGCLKHIDPILQSYAEDVMHVLLKYGLNIAKLNYQAETENLKLLVNELYTLESEKGILTQLGIIQWVNELKMYNEEFSTLYLKRNDSYAEIGLTSVTAGRNDANKLYSKMIELLDALIITKKDAFLFLVTRNKINALSHSYNEVISTRKGRNLNNEVLDE